MKEKKSKEQIQKIDAKIQEEKKNKQKKNIKKWLQKIKDFCWKKQKEVKNG